MLTEIRSQRKCYYASESYSRSFFGKYIYLYQGKSSLRLTTDEIVLESESYARRIPFDSIKGIGLGRFSSWAKPTGLEYLVVRYQKNDDIETIRLIPHESGFDSTLATSQLVESWFETLSDVEELSGRIETPRFDPVSTLSARGSGQVIAALMGAGILAAAICGLAIWSFR